MLLALNADNKRICANNSDDSATFVCPCCGAPVVARAVVGCSVKRFVHMQHCDCTDTWEREHVYDTSVWGAEWIQRFPEDNQEVNVKKDGVTHRADIMVGRTVIILHRGMVETQEFDDRNRFFFSLGLKAIWLLDVSDDIKAGTLSPVGPKHGGMAYMWNSKSSVFNAYDVRCGSVDLFFSFRRSKRVNIIRVLDINNKAKTVFSTSDTMSESEFCEYAGYSDGRCAPPERLNGGADVALYAFKRKYGINLNPQQQHAVRAVEGHNLLLAVPGSGKTTVLVARLGYMILVRNIPPESMLVLAYNVAAAAEMKERFIGIFGNALGNRIAFRTINSISYDIYMRNYRVLHPQRRYVMNEESKLHSLLLIYRTVRSAKFIDITEVKTISTVISYIKNKMLTREQIIALNKYIPQIDEIYAAYQSDINNQCSMDLDDQMVFASMIFDKDKTVLEKYKKKYKYISVDEAQDTSVLQHKVIRDMALTNNLFMVGDEDQSIYGFRAAYPQALLDFGINYHNPHIYRMECNYRSTSQIIEAAQAFVSRNSGRYNKTMIPARGSGAPVEIVTVDDVDAQHKFLLDVARERTPDTAFLYRNNDSAVMMVELFERYGIPYTIKKDYNKFFSHPTVKDIAAFIYLSLDSRDYGAFDTISYKSVLRMRYYTKRTLIKECEKYNLSVFDALPLQTQYVNEVGMKVIDSFREFIGRIATANSRDAIDIIVEEPSFKSYMQQARMETNKIHIMRSIAAREPDKASFLKRIDFLSSIFFSDRPRPSQPYPIVLSSIHGSKGREFNNVYIYDVYDGLLPNLAEQVMTTFDDKEEALMRERRLFYVGMTRAKNLLCLVHIKSLPSMFIDEVSRDVTRGGII